LESGLLDLADNSLVDAKTRKVALSDQPSYWLGLALMTEIDVQQALGHAGRVRALSVEALAQLTPSVGADHPLTRKAVALAGLR